MHCLGASTPPARFRAVNQYTRLFAHARIPRLGAPDELHVHGSAPPSFPDPPHFATHFVAPAAPVSGCLERGVRTVSAPVLWWRVPCDGAARPTLLSRPVLAPCACQSRHVAVCTGGRWYAVDIIGEGEWVRYSGMRAVGEGVPAAEVWQRNAGDARAAMPHRHSTTKPRAHDRIAPQTGLRSLWTPLPAVLRRQRCTRLTPRPPRSQWGRSLASTATSGPRAFGDGGGGAHYEDAPSLPPLALLQAAGGPGCGERRQCECS